MNVFLVEAIARGADVFAWIELSPAACRRLDRHERTWALAPAMSFRDGPKRQLLRAGSNGTGTGRAQHRLRSGFVVTQVALSLVLLLVASVLLRNLRDRMRTDLGFDANHTLSVAISLSRGHYEKRDPLPKAFYQPLLERVGSMPGVRGAGLIDVLPVAEWGDGYEIHITGQPPYPKNAAMGAETRNVSAGYFNAMGLSLRSGRLLDASLERPDVLSSKMVVNEAFRRKFFPDGGDPIGAHIDDDPKPEGKSQIVGVVSGLRQDLENPPMPEMDWLIDQIPAERRLDSLRNMFLIVRSSQDSERS